MFMPVSVPMSVPMSVSCVSMYPSVCVFSLGKIDQAGNQKCSFYFA